MGQSKHERSQASHPVSQAPLVPLHELEHPIQRTPMGASLSQRARRDPRSLSLSEVPFLQRTIGNRAVGQLFQSTAQRSAAGTAPLVDMSPLTQADHSLASSTLLPLQPRASGLDTPGEVLSQKKVPLHHVAESAHPKENTTGLPDALKAGVESLSGLSLDDVQVSYNSPQPSEIQALAYTQGTTIHIGPGQEQHLAHEAWHVVQQKQGRVSPTMQLHGRGVNDDSRLEREADMMGTRVSQAGVGNVQRKRASDASANTREVIQRVTVAVGFDRIGSGGKDDTLVTSGLAGCIAVVAYDQVSQTAVMVHWDTGKSTEESALQNLKSLLTKSLQARIGRNDIHPVFHVGLGGLWRKGKEFLSSKARRQLRRALKKVFLVERPKEYGNTIEFNVGTGVMAGNMGSTPKRIGSKPDLMPPENWEKAGEPLDYGSLVYGQPDPQIDE